jgi:hypothetical protein
MDQLPEERSLQGRQSRRLGSSRIAKGEIVLRTRANENRESQCRTLIIQVGVDAEGLGAFGSPTLLRYLWKGSLISMHVEGEGGDGL